MNAYFNNLKKEIADLEKKITEASEEKTRIRKEFGWGSEESEAAYTVVEQLKAQRKSHGVYVAIQIAAKMSEDGEVIFDDYFFDSSDCTDFIDTLRGCEVKSIILVNKSTALMDTIHEFVNNGLVLIGTCELEQKNLWGDVEYLKGIRFAF